MLCSSAASRRADMTPTAPITLLWYLWGLYGSPFHKSSYRTVMHQACWAAWCGWASEVVSHCQRHRWAASPVLGTEVCRSCGKSPRPPASSCATGFLIFCFSHPLFPSYWVMGSWGFSWSAWKCYCKSTQVQMLCFVASFSWLCFPFCTPFPMFFLSLPFLIIVTREGKERKHFRNKRLVCCIIKMSFVITFL